MDAFQILDNIASDWIVRDYVKHIAGGCRALGLAYGYAHVAQFRRDAAQGSGQVGVAQLNADDAPPHVVGHVYEVAGGLKFRKDAIQALVLPDRLHGCRHHPLILAQSIGDLGMGC
jgi:hypothetical protein